MTSRFTRYNRTFCCRSFDKKCKIIYKIILSKLINYIFSIFYINSKGTVNEWRNFLIICIIIYFIGAVCFVLFAKSELMKWAIIDSRSNDISKENSKSNKNDNLNDEIDLERMEVKF